MGGMVRDPEKIVRLKEVFSEMNKVYGERMTGDGKPLTGRDVDHAMKDVDEFLKLAKKIVWAGGPAASKVVCEDIRNMLAGCENLIFWAGHGLATPRADIRGLYEMLDEKCGTEDPNP